MAKQPSKKMKALLVGIQTGPTSDAEHARSMAELARLVDTLGMQVVHVMSQKLKTTNGSSLVGPGKLLEIAKWSGGTGVVEIETHQKISKARLKQAAEFEEFNPTIDSDEDELEDETPSLDQNGSPGGPKPQPVDFVIFDSEMTPTQNRNLQQALECEVLDRTGVIVEIFHRHAQSPAARAQVEIARLTYLTPRIRATGGGDRQGGGIGAKGAGETKHELDKRRIRDRIAELKATLEVTHKENALRRSRRRNNLKVALVGYTNAGKSSLMRALTGSEVLVADKLFATLDTTVRALQPETKPKIIATDTVGFIQKLPHELVASFKSTLDEAMDASLLLYVVDASDPAFRDQLKTTVDVLTEIEAHLVPHILILNKSDRLSTSEKKELTAEFPQGVLLSTRDQESVLALRNQLVRHFEKGMDTFKIHIPYTKAAALSEIHSVMQVTAETHGDEGTTIQAKGFSADFERIKKSFKL
jgi:GTP-binding protein HflX